MRKEKVVKDSLFTFLQQEATGVSISAVDDIVLNYIVSVLEDLGTEGIDEEGFDIDEFCEMITAYLPGFEDVDSSKVCEWIFTLAKRLAEVQNEVPTTATSTNKDEDRNSNFHIPGKPKDKSVSADLDTSETTTISALSQKRAHSISETSEDSVDSVGAAAPSLDSQDHVEQAQVSLLLEMFPSSCSIEVTHCLKVAEGDLDRAVQLVLHRIETGEQLTKKTNKKSAKRNPTVLVAADGIKDAIVSRYGYVDEDEDKRTHQPTLPKQEPKKLVMYRDSQVVSKRGEKFSEVKRDDSEEMKKTYVNLKPARKYRFH
ncbi:CUE domain-containing protein 2 [Lingula anatina]|uniref:CUE domain-containing protein 2 n=1 Tax=Lingula anatina TaxID=7574 RepID=A0A1S3JGI2_LINAN|nr:CUE domain-containing protein 2 [Lingula anatina]XP_013409508.1 CUE domain-containing protein 2 [Lingula anatina]|eukprot:XP_013409507.1 CUE domain-containing protein 2 [Lingula anatina]